MRRAGLARSEKSCSQRRRPTIPEPTALFTQVRRQASGAQSAEHNRCCCYFRKARRPACVYKAGADHVELFCCDEIFWTPDKLGTVSRICSLLMPKLARRCGSLLS
jgi:hypothetical protein